MARNVSRAMGALTLSLSLLAIVALQGCGRGSSPNGGGNVAGVFSATLVAIYDFSDNNTPNDTGDDTGSGRITFQVNSLNGTLDEYRIELRYTERDTGNSSIATIQTTTNPLTFDYLQEHQLFGRNTLDNISRIEFRSGQAWNTNGDMVTLGLPNDLDLGQRTPIAHVDIDYIQDGTNPNLYRVRVTRTRDRAGAANEEIRLTTERLDMQNPPRPTGIALFMNQNLPLVGGVPENSNLFVDTAVDSGVRHILRDDVDNGPFTYQLTIVHNVVVDNNGNRVLESTDLLVFAGQ